MSAHSPLPWRVFILSKPMVIPQSVFVLDEGGQNVLFRADIGPADETRLEPQSNAEFIVRCVNGHQLMVDLLTAIAADASAYQWHTAIANTLALLKAEAQ